MDNSNPFSPPAIEITDPGAEAAEIASLPVSEAWKARFYLIQKAGGVKLPKFKELTSRERIKVLLNFLGTLFAPFYYIAKGMWRKGVAMLLVFLLGVFLLQMMGLSRSIGPVWLSIAALGGYRANLEYYRKMVLSDNGWW